MGNSVLKKFSAGVLIILLMLSGASCNFAEEEYKREIYALDTLITLKAYGDNAEYAVDCAAEEITRLEKLFSVTDPSSDISRVNASAGEFVQVSEETVALLSRAVEISALTEGTFDITVYPVVSLWGFTTGEYKVPDERELEAALANVDYKGIDFDGNRVRIKKGMALDLGGIAKGYISARITEILKENGVTSAVVNLGGNVQTLGKRFDGNNWQIGIKDPESSSNFAILSCRETAVITSGGYQRNFTENGVTYHHIIDPESGYPAESGIASVTVISADAVLADALSTAFYVSGVQRSQSIADELGVDYIILTYNDEVYFSAGMADKIELNDDSLTPVT